MKLVKKILRLLPLIIFLYSMLLPMFTRLPFDIQEMTITTFMDYFNGPYDIFIDNYYFIFANGPFESVYDWFFENISDSSFFIISFGVLTYELYLSLMFLMFDFINMIFNWANKLINKGGNLDD